MPSVPKNGTPILTVKRKIIQALMGYTTVSTYSTFNTSPTTINLLRTGGEYLTKSLEKHTNYSIFISQQDMASKYNQPQRSKTALSWPLSPPRTPALHRGDAPLDHKVLGLTKLSTFLRLRSPGHKRACIEQHEASLVLLAL